MDIGKLRQLSDFQMDVNALVAPFFAKHKIRFFGYSRTYENRECFWLSTHPGIYEYLLKHQLPLNASAAPGDAKFFYHYTAPDTEYFEMTQEIILNFQLFHPLDLVFQRDGYYELFCLAVDHEDRNILNYYLNNLVHIKQFCLDFTAEATRLIKKAQGQSILLPDEMFLPVSNLILLKDLKKTQHLNMSTLIDSIMSEKPQDL